MSGIKLVPKWITEESDGDVFGLHYSSDNLYIGCALSNGQVSLYSGSTGRLSYSLENNSSDHFPVTSLRFHPSSKYFVTVSADGSIKCWRTRKPEIAWSIEEEKNQLFAVSVESKEGKSFATAGLDTKVRIYDFERHELKATFEKCNDFGTELIVPYHTNRVFSIIFDPNNENIIYSAGWDDTIQIWDIRMKRSVRSLFGAHICSNDGLDVFESKLAVGSWRTKEQLQVFDLRTFRVERTFKWSDDRGQCLVYTTKFHKNGEFLFAGGSGANEITSFSMKTGKQVGEAILFDSPVFSLAIANTGKEMVAGEGKGKVHAFAIE